MAACAMPNLDLEPETAARHDDGISKNPTPLLHLDFGLVELFGFVCLGIWRSDVFALTGSVQRLQFHIQSAHLTYRPASLPHASQTYGSVAVVAIRVASGQLMPTRPREPRLSLRSELPMANKAEGSALSVANNVRQ